MPDLVTQLLPVLSTRSEMGFNVFDVMHHGLHEKQVSNTFRWLLDAEGSHRLGDRFTRIFIDEVNRARPSEEPLAEDGYWVSQEVNTSGPQEPWDVADLVLESRSAVVVVENYFTSDGHGHNYDRYLAYSKRDRRQGAVVLLCREQDRSLQTLGWENAAVLTYLTLMRRLQDELAADRQYQQQNPEAYSFLQQMHRKFVTGRGSMQDHEVLDFVVAMCETGEAGRYQIMKQEVAAEQFAADLAEQARARFVEGRAMLHRVKAVLKGYSAEVLRPHLNESMGDGWVSGVSARYAGVYQWTINFEISEKGEGLEEAGLQLKFGPSAWFANEQDPHWHNRVDSAVADYSRLFITRPNRHAVWQSDVSLREVLDGLDPADRRLHDEILQVLTVDGVSSA